MVTSTGAGYCGLSPSTWVGELRTFGRVRASVVFFSGEEGGLGILGMAFVFPAIGTVHNFSKRNGNVCMNAKNPKRQAPTIENRESRFRYEYLEKFECGIELVGTEVKSVRDGKMNLRDST